MPKVEQYEYLSAEAKRLRARDGTAPWQVHPCEVDWFAGESDTGESPFAQSLRAARQLKAQIESDEDE